MNEKSTNNLDITQIFNEENQYNIPIILPFSKRKVMMREMVTGDQKKFLKQAMKLEDREYLHRKIGVLFNELIGQITQDAEVEDWILQDKLYFLLFLRCYLKGDATELVFQCDKCKQSNKFTYHLEMFIKKIQEMADSVELARKKSFGDYSFFIDAITIREEIEADALVSDEEWLVKENIGENELINLLRVASAIKQIEIPAGKSDLTAYSLEQRYMLLMRTPIKIMNDVVAEITDTLKKTMEFTGDKLTVPCLHENCDGKTEINIQLGDEGFFIKQSSGSTPKKK